MLVPAFQALMSCRTEGRLPGLVSSVRRSKRSSPPSSLPTRKLRVSAVPLCVSKRRVDAVTTALRPRALRRLREALS